MLFSPLLDFLDLLQQLVADFLLLKGVGQWFRRLDQTGKLAVVELVVCNSQESQSKGESLSFIGNHNEASKPGEHHWNEDDT